MKVIVAGAGIGGLVAAAALAECGLQVTVYEKAQSEDVMRYDWHDDVEKDYFELLGVKPPEGTFRKKNWSFASPCSEKVRRYYQEEKDADFSVERRALNRILIEKAKNAEIEFASTVTSPVIRDGIVTGVVVNGRKEEADLVIDSAGIFSPIRRALVKEGLLPDFGKDEIFMAYRAFFERNKSLPDPEYTNKVYLKHQGQNGISWAILDNDPNMVDVLIGRIGELDDETLADALTCLRKENPIIGEKVLRGGIKVAIPVRYPATRTVADGYVSIGDAAFLTIPMLGSGIASSTKAAFLLSETVKEALVAGQGQKAFSKENLWKYQVKIYRLFGAEHCGLDILKRNVLKMDVNTLEWMLVSDILTNDEIGKLAGGGMLNVSCKEILRKIKVAGIKRLGVLLELNGLLNKSKKAYRIAKKIPVEYDGRRIDEWEKSLNSLYG